MGRGPEGGGGAGVCVRGEENLADWLTNLVVLSKANVCPLVWVIFIFLFFFGIDC